MKYKYVIIIPARGGSKRLPRKNVLDLAGIPLILHSIKYAKNEFSEIPIFVSSDDEEILRIATDSQAIPLKRPDELSGDYITTADVLKYSAMQIEKIGVEYDYIILLQCTNPLRPDNLLHDAIEIIEKRDLLSLVGVSTVIDKFGKIVDNKFVPWNYKFGQRSQDLAPLYKENGQIYISHKSIISKGLIIDNNAFPMLIDHPYASIDIDTIDDFKKAEFLLLNYAK